MSSGAKIAVNVRSGKNIRCIVGRPVVSTWVAGIPELVKDGENGWLIPPGSVERLVEAMIEMLTAPFDELRRLGMNGNEAVQKFHNARHEAAVLEGYIREAVSMKPRI